ncbi:MAG TPA: hypothetical protein VK709_02875 [Candidatus Saccharimonadales bacterium]|nr:hypothetical protein [Candidatus Saccharimonadales bacterium]
MWRLQIVGCVLALGISFCPAHAAQDAQNQPVQNQAAPAAPPSASPSTEPAYEPSTSWPAAQTTGSSPATAPAPVKTIFHVKYISEGAIYLDAGRNEGLEEGMLLHLVHADPSGGTTEAVRFQGIPPIADVRVFSVADTSSAAEIIKTREDLIIGDIAYLDNESVRVREDKINAAESENYPVVVTFSYGDPLDEEIRANASPVSKTRIENQVRGRIGFDTGLLSEPGGISSRQFGLMIDADISRIGGTHWNFTGYWRGNLNTQNTGNNAGVTPVTLNDLVNRTYHLGLYYQNPDSIIAMGVGRLYLPYAPSLSTIDGGYFGYRITSHVTTGFFGGSTPDPTSWSYAPNQNIAGTFVNYEKGDFDHMRFSDTFGLAATSIAWHIAREFAFAENNISVGHIFSVFNSLQLDKGRTALGGVVYNAGLTQSFSSVRFQPIKFLAFNLNHNYLRNLPTFDPALISLGLLDQYLFQGLSGGVHVDLPFRIGISTDIGRSKNNTDTASSWNQMYGLTFGEIPKTGMQMDIRYTKFNSSFGQGSYQFISLSRAVAERFHVQLQGGVQHLTSSFSTNSSSKFVASTVDWTIGPRYFFEGLFSWNMGTTMNYQQTNFTFGYRFGGSLRK